MELREIESLKDFNELDLLYKIIDIAESIKVRTELVVVGNKTAGTDVRHSMQDIRLIAELIREAVQIRKGTQQPKLLDRAIFEKKESIRKEEEGISRAENLRKKIKAEKIK